MTRPKTDPKMETDRKREEAIDKELASPRPPLPKLTRHRVSNAVGSLVTGARGRRRVMLLHRPAWRDLHSVDDLWISALAKAPRLLLGVVEMTMTEPGLYVVTTATSHEGFASMLKALTSCVVRFDEVRALDYLGARIRPNKWGPFFGMRRRGLQAVKAVQRAHGLDDRIMDQMLDQISRTFVARFVSTTAEI
jgi:hypothetical protein